MNADRRIQEPKHINYTLNKLATKVDQDETKCMNNQECVSFVDEKVSETVTQLLSKCATVSAYKERVAMVEEKLASLSADVIRLRAQSTAVKILLNAVRTALAVYKMASQLRASKVSARRENLLAGMVVVETEFGRYQTKEQVKIVLIKADRECIVCY